MIYLGASDMLAWTLGEDGTGGFKAYVHKKAENHYLLDDFLAQGVTAATPRNLSEIIGANEALIARPQDLVFHEAGAKLLGPNGKSPKW